MKFIIAIIVGLMFTLMPATAQANTPVTVIDPRHAGCGADQRVTVFVPEGVTATSGDHEYTNGERVTPGENLQVTFVANEGYEIERYGKVYYWIFNSRPCKTPMFLEVYDSPMTKKQYVITGYLATLDANETPYPGQYIRLQRYNFEEERWITVRSFVTNSYGSAHFTMDVDNLRYRLRFGGDPTHRWAISPPFSPRQWG